MSGYLYKNLNRAKIAHNFLESNATTHSFLFGAIAELVDNSRDANAQNMYITAVRNSNHRGQYLLYFNDDGEGMDPSDAANVIIYGKSRKRQFDKIGQYGNGLKSGSMRLGKDAIVFSKKNSILTAIFLSKTFNQDENVQDELIVPMPSFNEHDLSPWFEYSIQKSCAQEKHITEIEIILKYSPFKTRKELLKQFEMIEENSGTLIVIYNLMVNSNCEPEFDFEKDPNDFLINNYIPDYEKKLKMEYQSLRSYLSILYYKPRMKMFIQGKKVQTKFLERTLAKLKCSEVPVKFKDIAKQQKETAEQNLFIAIDRLKEANSMNLDLLEKISQDEYNTQLKHQLKISEQEKRRAQYEVESCKEIIKQNTKSLNETKTLKFMFGLNLENRWADGLFIYNNDRLILMYQPSKKPSNGVIGIINLPYQTITVAHSKQNFKEEDQRKLLNYFNEHLNYYLKAIGDEHLNLKFWQKYGYYDNSKDLPDNQIEFYRKRVQETGYYLQCDSCLKWRCLEWNSSFTDQNFPSDKWTCDSCQIEEKLTPIEKIDWNYFKEQNKNKCSVLNSQQASNQNQYSSKLSQFEKSSQPCTSGYSKQSSNKLNGNESMDEDRIISPIERPKSKYVNSFQSKSACSSIQIISRNKTNNCSTPISSQSTNKSFQPISNDKDDDSDVIILDDDESNSEKDTRRPNKRSCDHVKVSEKETFLNKKSRISIIKEEKEDLNNNSISLFANIELKNNLLKKYKNFLCLINGHMMRPDENKKILKLDEEGLAALDLDEIEDDLFKNQEGMIENELKLERKIIRSKCFQEIKKRSNKYKASEIMESVIEDEKKLKPMI